MAVVEEVAEGAAEGASLPPPRGPPGPRKLLVDWRGALDQVDGRLTVAGPKVPHLLKVRLKRQIWPLNVAVGVDYDPHNRTAWPVARVKDAIAGGRFRVNLGEREIAYRKDVEVAQGWRVQFGASVQPKDDMSGLKNPRCLFSFEPSASSRVATKYGADVSVVGPAVGDNQPSFDMRAKVPLLSKNLKAEVCANCKLPFPAARFSHDAEDGAAELSLGRGSVHLHVAQANLALYV